MTASVAAFGFRAAYHPSGIIHPRKYAIATGLAVNLFNGDPVKLLTDGTITLGTSDASRTGTVTGTDILGVFVGVEYLDSTGKPVVSNFWPTGTAATNIRAWVVDDPAVVFEVQADGAIPVTGIGAQANMSGFAAPGGSTSTGISSATLNSTLIAAASQGTWRIVDIANELDNAAGDAYTVVQVSLATHQYIANKVGI